MTRTNVTYRLQVVFGKTVNMWERKFLLIALSSFPTKFCMEVFFKVVKNRYEW